MGTIKQGGNFRARGDISIGGSSVTFGADAVLYRSAANVLHLGSGDTFRVASGTGATGTEARLVIPHSTALAGTAFPASNGEVVLTQRGAGTVVLVGRLNGTNYYSATMTALT